MAAATGEHFDQVTVQGNQGGFRTQTLLKGIREGIVESTLTMGVFKRGRQGWEEIQNKFFFQNFVLNWPCVDLQAAKFKLLSCQVLDS